MTTCSLLLLFVCACVGWSALVSAVDDAQFGRAMATLNGTVHYLNTHLSLSVPIREYNAIVTGQLKVLLDRMTKSSSSLTQDQLEWLREEYLTAQSTSSKSQALDEQLFGRDSWHFFYPSRLTDSTKAYRTQEPEILSDREFNYCLDQVFGSNKFESKGACKLSAHCWKTMTAPDRSTPYLVQQLVYLTSAENFGCQSQMELMAKDSGQEDYHRLYEAICATLQPSVVENEAAQQWEDAVYQQMLLCGMLGFRDFSPSSQRVDWWSSLQMEDGCIGDKVVPKPSQVGFFEKLFGLQAVATCLIERTVAVAALLTQHVRFLLDDSTTLS